MEINKQLFTSQAYKFVINELAKHGFVFKKFRDICEKEGNDKKEKVCLLRHDVDVSLKFAFDMAIVEADMKVYSTFFVMLRSSSYNLMSSYNTELLRKIASLGHEIALHFDANIYEGNIGNAIAHEASILENLVNKKVYAFSFHQPTREIIDQSISVKGNLVNAYNDKRLEDYYYFSDSNRQWDQANFQELLGHDAVQLLFHPMWWMCPKEDIEEVWDEANIQNFKMMEQQLIKTERAYGAMRQIRLIRSSSSDQV